MQKRLFGTVAALVSILVFCFTMLLSPTDELSKADILTVKLPQTTQAADGAVQTPENTVESSENDETYLEDTNKFTETSSEAKILNMLNINYCYTDAFKSTQRMAIAASVSLKDFAVDLPGYGICVSKVLTEGFIKSFYGLQLDLTEIETEYAPEKFIALPCYEVGAQNHEIVSITETESGKYEVISLVTFYYGGYDTETYTAKSHFIINSCSEYGFNLLDCTLL